MIASTDTAEPGYFYGYLRVSDPKQEKHGLSKDAQESIIRAYYEVLKHRYPGLKWGGIYSETATSAYKVPLLARKAGARMNAELGRGDHVCFVRIDRGFRNQRDCLNTLHLWEGRGIKAHFTDIQMDTSTPFGRLMLQILAAFAELESGLKSARVREVLAWKKSQGLPNSPNTPHGCKKVGKGRVMRFVPDHQEEAIMLLIVYYRRQKGWSFDKISDRVEELLAKREGRKPITRFWKEQRRWNRDRVRKGFYAEAGFPRQERQAERRRLAGG